MCFGQEQTDQKTTTSNANPFMSSQMLDQMDFVKKLRDSGFQSYGGNQVADFSDQQKNSFDMVNNIAGNDTASRARALLDQYSGTGPQSVTAGKIFENMSPYMNQYVMQALAPQMQQFDLQAANNRRQTDATATSSNAFGDARTGIEQATNTFNNNVAREGVIGNAYNNAFNTAIGAGAQDVSNKLQADTTTGNFTEQYLQRVLGGAQGLQQLQNQQLGVANAQNAVGQQQTAQQQAKLTAAYNQWLMAQQYPFQTSGLMNQTLGVGSGVFQPGSTTTETKPNNSGWSLLGALGGAALAPFTGGMSLGLTGSALSGMGGSGWGGGDASWIGGSGNGAGGYRYLSY